jgi:hypothetical protein
MKVLLTIISTCLFILIATGQKTEKIEPKPDPNKKTQTVEASCGLCQFGLKAKDCSLAVRIDGKAYFVDGTSIDDHGNAHAKDGFCNAIRKAEVQGEIADNRFKATYFKLIAKPENKDIKNTNQ